MITSTSNNKVKRLVALRDKSKVRREEKAFIVEGAKMFGEAPKEWVREVYVSEGFLNKCDSILKAKLETVRYEVLSDDVFKKVSDTQTPQGILAVLSMPHYELSDYVKTDNQLFIILEDIQDPGNLGTIIRSGEGAGVSGVILTKNTSDIFNPKVIRSTMGSIYRVPFFITDDIYKSINMLKENNIAVYAAHLDNSIEYDKKDYTKPTAFLIGNESMGLKRETADLATAYIKIPMLGRVESLNAALATTILMYEAGRQRRSNK